MITAIFLILVVYAMARAIDAFAAYLRRTDPWGRV